MRTLLSFLLFICTSVVQAQTDYHFVLSDTPWLSEKYPRRSDIPQAKADFYALSYDSYSNTAFIYNDYVCGYYDVPQSLKSGFKARAKDLQSTNPELYWDKVKSIMNKIDAYWQTQDSINNIRVAKARGRNPAFANMKIYDIVDEMPSFPGGTAALMQYIGSNLNYPLVAQENGVQGRVIISFVVEPDGTLDNIKVSRSVDCTLDKEALRVVSSMPKWIPGKNKGVPVRVKYNVPVTFKL